MNDFPVRGTTKMVFGVLVFGGGRELLKPTDVRLRTIDFIMLQRLSPGINPGAEGFPVGSLSLKGSAGVSGADLRSIGYLQGRGGDRGLGSNVTLVWAIGSGVNDTGFGSVASGSKSAFFIASGDA